MPLATAPTRMTSGGDKRNTLARATVLAGQELSHVALQEKREEVYRPTCIYVDIEEDVVRSFGVATSEEGLPGLESAMGVAMRGVMVGRYCTSRFTGERVLGVTGALRLWAMCALIR